VNWATCLSERQVGEAKRANRKGRRSGPAREWSQAAGPTGQKLERGGKCFSFSFPNFLKPLSIEF
jgi:hypothetical protein